MDSAGSSIPTGAAGASFSMRRQTRRIVGALDRAGRSNCRSDRGESDWCARQSARRRDTRVCARPRAGSACDTARRRRPPPQTARPPLPAPGPELRGQWRGTISSCPRTLEFSLDIRGTHDLVATLGDGAAQVAEAGAAARGEASGTLKPSADMASSTLEFDLFVKEDHLEGPVIRRTNLGPRGNVTVTLWAVLTREK